MFFKSPSLLPQLGEQGEKQVETFQEMNISRGPFVRCENTKGLFIKQKHQWDVSLREMVEFNYKDKYRSELEGVIWTVDHGTTVCEDLEAAQKYDSRLVFPFEKYGSVYCT